MFTYDIQYGGDPYDKYEFMGSTDFDNFMSVVENFPWINEMEKANASPDGSSPTLSVQNIQDGKDVWISIAGDRINYGYLLGYIYLKTRKAWPGLGLPKPVYWLEIYLARDILIIKHYLQLYFACKYDVLHAELRQLYKFKDMEAPRRKER